MTNGILFLLFITACIVARLMWTKEHMGSNAALGRLIYMAGGAILVLGFLVPLLYNLDWPWVIQITLK